jgi:hypothetical protein
VDLRLTVLRDAEAVRQPRRTARTAFRRAGAQRLPTCYGLGRPANAEYDDLRKTAAESKVALGKVAAVQA